MKKDKFVILIDSALPNKILIYDRTTNEIREILNPNPSPEYFGLRILPAIGGNPLLLVRDRENVSVVDFTSGILVNLFSSPLDVDIMSEFYLDVREEDGRYDIFAIEYLKGSISQIIKHTVPEAIIREIIEGYKQL
jgi:hypothetical protein